MGQKFFFEKNEYIDKKNEYLKEKILTEEDFVRAIANIEDKYKKKENSEQVLKKVADKVYTLRYYYDKKEKQIELSTVLEYSVNCSIRTYLLLIYFILMVIWQWFVLELNICNISLNLLSIILLILALIWFKKVKMIYKPVFSDLLSTIKISLDPTDLNKKNIYYNLSFSTYSFFISSYILYTNSDTLVVITKASIIIALIFLFINFVKWVSFTSVSVAFFFSLLLLSILLDRSIWEGIAIIQTIVLFIFTDDVWELKYSNNFKSSLENLNFETQKLINNRKFKYKVSILGMNLVLYYAIVLFEKIPIHDWIQSQFSTNSNIVNFLLERGIFIIFLEVIFSVVLLIIKSKRTKLILNGIVKSIIGKIYGNFPIIKDKYLLNRSELDNFEPVVLVENINDLSEEYSFEMKKPIKEGTNVLLIKKDNEISIVEVKIYFKC